MAESIVIDIKANFTDNASSGARKAQKEIDKLEKSAKSLSNKKHSVRLEVEDKATSPIKKVQSAAKSFASTAYRSDLSLNDKASIILNKVKSSVKSWASQKWQSTITFLDKASNVITKVESAVRGFVGKTWRTTLSVVDKFTSPLTKLKNMLFSINSLITTVAAGLATKLVVAEPVSYADTITTASIAFETMLGSAEAADKMMSDIMEFAKTTPFDTTGLINSTQQMMAFGFEAETTLDYMEKIGNVMAAMGKGEEGIDSVTRALGQMSASGRVNAQDMLQLTSAGITAWDYVAEGMGKTVAEVRKMSEDGELDAATAIKHIMAGLEEFDGMMDKMSNRTVSGLWSNIKDTFQQSVVLEWGEGLQKGAIAGLEDMRDWLERIDPLLQSAGTSLSELGESVSTSAFDLLNGALQRLSDTISSDEFQNAETLGEKIKIVWDEVIWEPFSEWWESTGKPKFAEKMYDLGESIGTGLSNGLLTLLGIDVQEAVDDGSSIGASLAEGFIAGFDGEAVGEALLNAIKSVFASGGSGLVDMLLPGDQGASAGDKLIGAGLAIGGTYLVGKGIVAANSAYTTLSSAGSALGNWAANSALIGSTGNAMVSGSGILGGLANVGYGLTGGAYASTLAGGSGLTGAGAAAVGAGSIAGGIAGGAALISAGVDFYNMYKAAQNGNEDIMNANLLSGTSKFTGVGTGALIGGMIGGPAGALIGAGIGGVAGWIGGDYFAEKYLENAEETKRKAEAARYESEEMKAAIMDSNSSAEDLANTFRDVVNADIAERFGDVKLTMSEIAAIAKEIVFGDNLESFETFANAAASAEASLYNLKSSVATLNKTNWKLGVRLGLSENGKVSLSDTDIYEITQSVESYIASAEQYVEDQHYEFTAAVSLLLDTSEGSTGANIIANGDAFYTSIQTELQKLGTKLSETTQIALSDGVLTLDEQAELTNLQQQIANITNKLASAQADAEFAVIKMKFSLGDIDAASFANLQAELKAQAQSATDQYDTAITTSITSLNLQLADGAISQEQYNEQFNALVAGYKAKIDNLNAQVTGIQLEVLAENYSDLLGEDGAANLQNAINEAVKTGISPLEWTAEETASLLGLESLSVEMNAELTGFISQVVESMGTAMSNADLSALNTAAGTYMGPPVANAIGTAIGNADFSTSGTAAVTGVSDAITNADKTPIDTAADGVRTYTETAVDTAFNTPISTTASVDITIDWNIVNPTTTITTSGDGVSSSSVTVSASVARNANGGFINGKTLSWLGEEGTPEVVIPLGSHRRGRAMDLWERTGELLGVQPDYNALGGIVGATMSETPTTNTHGGKGNITVEVGGVTISVNADGSGDVLTAIKAQKDAIADVIAGAIYEGLNSQFSNTPLAAK